MAENEDTVPATTLAKLFGITDRQVRNLAKDGIIPAAVSRGRYSLAASIQAYIAHLKAEAKGKPQGIVVASESARLKAAQADKAEIENRVRAGELVSKADIQHAVRALMTVLTQSLNGYASRFAATPEQRKGLMNAARETRQEVVDKLRELEPT